MVSRIKPCGTCNISFLNLNNLEIKTKPCCHHLTLINEGPDFRVLFQCYCCTTQTPVPSSLYSREIIIHTTLNTQGHTITAQRLTAAAPAVTACQFV